MTNKTGSDREPLTSKLTDNVVKDLETKEPAKTNKKRNGKDDPSKIKKSISTRGESSKNKKPEAEKMTKEDDLAEIKNQLNSLMAIIPVVNELKHAYDKEMEECEVMEEAVGLNLAARPKNDEVRKEPDPNLNLDLESVEEQEDGEIDLDDDGPCSSISYFRNVAGTTKPEGPKINEDLATCITNILCNGLQPADKGKLFEKYMKPSNCPRMDALPCNPEIFKSVRKETRQIDSGLQKIQNTSKKPQRNDYVFRKTYEPKQRGTYKNKRRFKNSHNYLCGLSGFAG